MPIAGVMRFDRSISMSVSRPPSGPGGLTVTCGSDISSATNGSSVKIVAGKKRWPANPCANAVELVEKRIMDTGTAVLQRVRSISIFPYLARADDRPMRALQAHHRVVDRVKTFLSSYRRGPSAHRAGRPAREDLCRRRENGGRLGKTHRFQGRGMDWAEARAEVPRTACRMGVVIRGWSLFGRLFGVAILRGETQCVREIAGAASGADEQRCVEAGQCDPQQQSDRREKLTHADVSSPASAARSWCWPS